MLTYREHVVEMHVAIEGGRWSDDEVVVQVMQQMCNAMIVLEDPLGGQWQTE